MMSQGKCVVETLKRFGTMDCKSMTTPMTTNLKLFGDTTSERVDATLYKKMIGLLMYFDEHEARYILCSKHLESVYG